MNKIAGKIKMKEKLGYGIGALSLDLSYGLINSFLMIYFTDVLLIAPAFIAIVFSAARIWDGINDPMMGTVVDNTKTKWGRFRPWIFIGALLNAVVLIMLFTNPGFQTSADTVNVGLYAYVAILYVLWGMSYTIVDIPYWSMVPALTSDKGERDIIAMVARGFSGAGQLIVAALTLKMISVLGKGNEALGYQRWAMVAALLFFLGALITVCSTKEKIVMNKNESFSLGKAFKIIKANDQLLVFIVVAICYNTGWYLTNGLGIYYFTYIMENKGLYSKFAIVVGAGQAIGLFLFPLLSKKLTKFVTVKGAMAITFIGYIGMFICTKANAGFVAFCICSVLACAGIGCMFVSQTVMLADIVDYGEYKIGKRTDSIVFSMKSFLQKMAYTIQALVMGFGLQFSKYQENVVPQPKPAQDAIVFMMFIIPPALILISFIVFSKKYKLHGKYFEEISEKVNQMHIDNHTLADED